MVRRSRSCLEDERAGEPKLLQMAVAKENPGGVEPEGSKGTKKP